MNIVFDRIGNNDHPPLLRLPDDLSEWELRERIREHVLDVGLFDDGYDVYPVVRQRRIGGWEIGNSGTSYIYGIARISPVFVEDTFAAAAELALAGPARTDASNG